MWFPILAIPLTGLLLFPLTARAQGARIISVDPLTAKVGDLVSAHGEGIGAANVDELYLTNDVQDVKVEMIEQTDTLIKFKVPTGVKPGRWAPMTHMKSGSGPKLIEQPVKLTVE
jgi:hypothetical protein